MGPWDIAKESQDGKDWAYHWAIWKDVDNDGLEDCITARYQKNSGLCNLLRCPAKLH